MKAWVETTGPERRHLGETIRMTETPTYCERVLHAPDVCMNCHRTIRVERVDPTRRGLVEEYESHYERDPQTTQIGYGPARSASNVKGVFCDRCGTEGPNHRIWDDAADRLDDRRFRELIKATIRTLEHKGVSIHRHALVRNALQRRKDGAHVDDCLGRATEDAIVAEVARDDADGADSDKDRHEASA